MVTNAEPRSEDALLAACPRCDYALRGLPVDHACPECGFAVDRRWLVFGGPAVLRRRRRWAFSPLPALLFVLVPIWLVISAAAEVGATGRLSRNGQLLRVAVLLVVVIASVAFARLAPKRFIVLAADGIHVYGPRGVERSHTWSNAVGRARYDFGKKAVVIDVDGAPMRLGGFDVFRDLTDEADRCVRAINAYPRAPEPA